MHTLLNLGSISAERRSAEDNGVFVVMYIPPQSDCCPSEGLVLLMFLQTFITVFLVPQAEYTFAHA